MIELAQLRLFVGVAEDLHFSRAASRLFITQPALSRRIRALEQSLGAELFSRGHRRVALTPAGKELLTRARTILADTVAAEEATRNASQRVARPLNISFVSSAAPQSMPHVLRALRSCGVDAPFTVRNELEHSAIGAVRSGSLDIAITDQSVHDTDLACHRIARASLRVALPAQDRRAQELVTTQPSPRGRTRTRRATSHAGASTRVMHIDLASLANDRFIIVTRHAAPGVYDAFTQSCRGAGFTPHIAHEARTPQEALAMVGMSLGIAIVPSPSTPPTKHDVVWAAFTEPAPFVEFTAVWRRTNDHPALHCFVEALRLSTQTI